jgi:hypothetical protein
MFLYDLSQVPELLLPVSPCNDSVTSRTDRCEVVKRFMKEPDICFMMDL